MFSSFKFNKNNSLTLNTSRKIKNLDKHVKTILLKACKIVIKNVQTDSNLDIFQLIGMFVTNYEKNITKLHVSRTYLSLLYSI